MSDPAEISPPVTSPSPPPPPRRNLWQRLADRGGDLWEQTAAQVNHWLPIDAMQLSKAYSTAQNISQDVSQNIFRTFSVRDDQIADILQRVRAELPTTEALLIGKPQAGKSSIVRGLTGVSDEIVGQGFRPHTQHTERYAYPSDDLPLLIFTDTVGLGD
ncbi:MAG: GTPase, partial [Phormidesmis sp.]